MSGITENGFEFREIPSIHSGMKLILEPMGTVRNAEGQGNFIR